MQSEVLNRLGFDPGWLMLVLLILMVFILLYLASVSMKMSRFMRRYKLFMRGRDGVSLEKAFESEFIEVERIAEQNKNQASEIANLKEMIDRTPMKTGIVRTAALCAGGSGGCASLTLHTSSICSAEAFRAMWTTPPYLPW